MDHSCHNCGHTIEDGKAFCAQCGAPQIRVTVSDSPSQIAGSGPAAALPMYPPDPATLSRVFPSAIAPSTEWKRALGSCAIAALVSIVAMLTRLIGPIVAVLAAGFLSVIFYYRGHGPRVASASFGAKLGALTGLLSSAVLGVMFGIFVEVMRSGGEVRQELLDRMHEFAAKSNDPQILANIELLKTPEGLTKVALGMVGLLVISIAAGSIAGAITGAFLGRRRQP